MVPEQKLGTTMWFPECLEHTPSTIKFTSQPIKVRVNLNSKFGRLKLFGKDMDSTKGEGLKDLIGIEIGGGHLSE